MAKIRKMYICAHCGSIIEYGDIEAIEYGDDIYCDEDCLFNDLGIYFVDWSCREEFEDDCQTRENLYGAWFAKDRIVTNGHYAIFGADISDIDFNFKIYEKKLLCERLCDIRDALKNTKSKVVRLSECKVIDNTDGHIKVQDLLAFIEILGCKLDKRYVDLCVELLGLSDELRVYNEDPESPLLIEADDERFAVIMPVLWCD